jgi:hypothetical protein
MPLGSLLYQYVLTTRINVVHLHCIPAVEQAGCHSAAHGTDTNDARPEGLRISHEKRRPQGQINTAGLSPAAADASREWNQDGLLAELTTTALTTIATTAAVATTTTAATAKATATAAATVATATATAATAVATTTAAATVATATAATAPRTTTATAAASLLARLVDHQATTFQRKAVQCPDGSLRSIVSHHGDETKTA